MQIRDRVAHAFNSTLLGWLVLLPTRHITSFAQLTPQASDDLGGLIRTAPGPTGRGTRTRGFMYLTDDESQWLPKTQRDAVALDLRAALG